MNEKSNIHVIPLDDYDVDDNSDSIRTSIDDKINVTTRTTHAASPSKHDLLKHGIIAPPRRKHKEENSGRYSSFLLSSSSPSPSMSLSFDNNNDKSLVEGKQPQPRICNHHNQTKSLIRIKEIHEFQRCCNHTLQIGCYILREESRIINHELRIMFMMKKQEQHQKDYNYYNNPSRICYCDSTNNNELTFYDNHNIQEMVNSQSVRGNEKCNSNKRSCYDSSHEHKVTSLHKKGIHLYKSIVAGKNDSKRRKMSTEASSDIVLNGSDDSYPLKPAGTSTSNNMKTNHQQRLVLDPTTRITVTKDQQHILLYKRALRMKNFAIYLKNLKMMQKRIIMELKSSCIDE